MRQPSSSQSFKKGNLRRRKRSADYDYFRIMQQWNLIMAQKHRPLTSVLVKPSGPDCNLGCTYCFYLDKEKLFPETKSHPMSAEVQEEMIRQVMQQSGDAVSIAWQGGEPALMGLDFYERAIELEQKYGHGAICREWLSNQGSV